MVDCWQREGNGRHTDTARENSSAVGPHSMGMVVMLDSMATEINGYE